MTDISEREACTKRCWWLGAGVGLLVAFLLLAFGIWGLLMSILAGVLVAVIVMLLVDLGGEALVLLRQGGAAEATREVRRLHSRAGGLENAGDMLVGARARRHLIGRPFLEWMPLVPGQGFDHRTPGPVLRPVCRRPQPAVPAEFAVDVMGGAKVRHLIHAMRRGLGETNRFVRGAEGCERAETAPPAQHEATIASARAVAAAVLFDNHDIERRLALL